MPVGCDKSDWHLLPGQDRKSTRLNSSHLGISYAVFCLKKKKKRNDNSHSAYTEKFFCTIDIKLTATHGINVEKNQSMKILQRQYVYVSLVDVLCNLRLT